MEVEVGPPSRSSVSAAVTIPLAGPAVLRVQRHLLDDPQLVALRAGRTTSRSGAWWSLTPRISTAFTFTGRQPRVAGGRHAGPARRRRRSRRVRLAKRLPVDTCRARRSPREAGASASGRSHSGVRAEPVGGERELDPGHRPGAAARTKRSTRPTTPRPVSGSPPVSRTLRTPRQSSPRWEAAGRVRRR